MVTGLLCTALRRPRINGVALTQHKTVGHLKSAETCFVAPESHGGQPVSKRHAFIRRNWSSE